MVNDILSMFHNLTINIKQKKQDLGPENLLGNELDVLESKLEGIKQRIVSRNNDSSSQFLEALFNLLVKIENTLPTVEDSTSIQGFLDISIPELNRLEILENLANTKDNVVIVGSNGAGKSSFVSSLQQSSISNMVVMPAQKSLFYYPDAANRSLYNKNVDDVRSTQKMNFIDRYKGDLDRMQLQREYMENFSVLVAALSNDFIKQQMKILQKEKNALIEEEIILNKLIKIWDIIIPNIDLKVETDNRLIYPVKDGQSYKLNSLSDGEKCIIYYIGNILIAPLIVIL